MPKLSQADADKLRLESDGLKDRYRAFLGAGLALDMTRGKPCAEQLDLSSEMLSLVGSSDFKSGQTDCRNYGGLDGLPEAKELFRHLIEVGADEIIVGGNSSLNLMYETVAHAYNHGVPGGERSWREQAAAGSPIKFICPTPGYDRHFSVCEHLGIEMLAVPSDENGPDMDAVEALLREDTAIKGMWVVPKYANPTGVTLSKEVVSRLAKMAAPADFRLLWDNAYGVHHLGDAHPVLDNILTACKAAGNPDRPFIYGSTSKISFAGSGVAVMGGSVANMDWMRSHLSIMTIGPDKLNQLRHVRFFEDFAGIEAHMKKHAAVIAPKFVAVHEVLGRELGGSSVAEWNTPQGGYFINFDTVPGCAKRVVELAKNAGVKLTAAGATYPYGNDPNDTNIRIAPTLPSLDEIKKAMEVFSVCVRLATLETL